MYSGLKSTNLDQCTNNWNKNVLLHHNYAHITTLMSQLVKLEKRIQTSHLLPKVKILTYYKVFILVDDKMYGSVAIFPHY